MFVRQKQQSVTGAVYTFAMMQRSRAKARVDGSEQLFRRLLENAQDVVYRYRVTPPRGYDYINSACLAITGHSPEEFYDNPDLALFKKRILETDYFVMDQWQLEELAKVVAKCKVKVVTDGLPPETLRKCYVEPAESVESAVAASLAEYGSKATIAVIPKGPYVLPYVVGV